MAPRVACTSALAAAALPSVIGGSFDGVPFFSEGVARSADTYVQDLRTKLPYLECEECEKAQWAWATNSLNYTYQKGADGKLETPPLGIRSAVPLGGVGAGSFEIRADGSVREVTIVNQSPSGAAKMNTMEGFVMAVRESASGAARLFRTRQPDGHGLPSDAIASALHYQGSFPVSKWHMEDSAFPADLEPTLYGFSRLRHNDLEHSVSPAVAFSLDVANSKDVAREVSFLVTLPLAVVENYGRRGPSTPAKEVHAASAVECLGLCQKSASTCEAWEFVLANSSCALLSEVPLGAFRRGSTSGVRGIWSLEGGCLTMNWPPGVQAAGPAVGNASLCAPAAAELRVKGAAQQASVRASFATGDRLSDLYGAFASAGAVSGVSEQAAYGAMVVTVTLPPLSSATVSSSFSWFFPYRDYMGSAIGNFYSTAFSSSMAVGQDMLAQLTITKQDLAAFLRPWAQTSLPDWLTETLLNSFSHVRSAWYQRNGHWRQWEAYDCVNVDSIHNDGERHLPYIFFLPETTRNKILAWSKTQDANGMLPEQLACGCMAAVDPNLDKGCGRVMSDVSSMFVVYLLEFYRWNNDTALLRQFWPAARRAAEWHLTVSTATGVPQHQVNTYDILGPEQHPEVSYNSAFHILAMKAAAALASSPVVADAAFAKTCEDAAVRAQGELEKQWVELPTGRGYYSFGSDDPSGLMVDSFYAQVLAYSVGLGDLLANATRLRMHLAMEEEWNDTPFGLGVLTREVSGKRVMENGVWQMGSPNWAVLNLHLGMPVEEALKQPQKSLENWRTRLRDLWNIAGVADQASGLASVTSHYGYFMSSWHLVLAISGQQADLPEGSLTFDPKVKDTFRLPVFLPEISGSLHSPAPGNFVLDIHAGQLPSLRMLRCGQCAYPGSTPIAKAGRSLVWSCPPAPAAAETIVL